MFRCLGRMAAAAAISGLPLYACAQSPPAATEAPTPSSRQVITRWIHDLGAPQFAAREQASAALASIGIPTLSALRDGAQSDDREVRFRCQQLLALVEEMDFRRRLSAFLEGTDSAQALALAGWQGFQHELGDSPASRELFVEMQRDESHLMAELERDATAAASLVTARARQIQQTMMLTGQPVDLGLGTVAAMLFVALDEHVQLAGEVSQQITTLLYQARFRDALTRGPFRDLLRKMLAHWVQRADGLSRYQMLFLALEQDLPEGLLPAEKILESNDPLMNQPHFRQIAMVTVARFGGPRHIPLVERCLDDATEFGGVQRLKQGTVIKTEIRDIALATVVHLAGEDHAKFGFKRLQKHPQHVFTTQSAGFESAAEREAAIAQWRAYRSRK